jgi:hypothetical protein
MPELPRLYSLKEAAALLHCRVAPSSLRKAAHAGKLKVYVIGGKHFTTETALIEFLSTSTMRPPCRVNDNQSDSGSAARAGTESPPGASSTDRARLALEQALINARRLKKRCSSTSSRATVHRLRKSRSSPK